MLVSQTGVLGTIGGGQLEYMAIDAARTRLTGQDAATEISVPLGPDIGQCCGGHVTFTLTKVTEGILQALLNARAQELNAQPNVYVFGSGHVGRALALALQPLPVSALLVDNRAQELELADPSIELKHTALPEALVREAPAGSAFVVLTHDHALDFLITREALTRSETAQDVAYIGMIGSKTKRATFASWLKSETGHAPLLNQLVMPIGESQLMDKRPTVIAAMVAAQIMEAVGVWNNTTDPDGAPTNLKRRISV